MWIALANIEWCYGFLSNEVRCIALEVIKREKKNLMSRKKVVPYIAALHKVYDDQEKLLHSPSPETEASDKKYTMEYFIDNFTQYSY